MVKEPKVFDLKSTFIVIEPNQSVIPIDVTSTFFQDLEKRFESFQNRLLVSCFSFDKDWSTWEIHPKGDEIVYLLSGEIEMIFEKNGTKETIPVNKPGSCIIIPKDTWHTAKIKSPSTMLFITSGQDTENKPVLNSL